ncbi:hypothetical protein MASR2M29_16020 [Spirochaetota bacterium]
MVLFAFNVFFISNWKIFSILENEKWEELSRLLQHRIFSKKQYSKRIIRLYINSTLLLADISAIERLEEELRKKKPAALKRDALLFGAVRLLKNDAKASIAFFEEFLDKKGVDNAKWLNFYYGFSLILDKRAGEAVSPLLESLKDRDSILSLMSAYSIVFFCASSLDNAESAKIRQKSESRRQELQKLYASRSSKSMEGWVKAIEAAKSEVHVVVLSKLLDEAGTWLFNSGSARKE